jgi:hypothetical protein
VFVEDGGRTDLMTDRDRNAYVRNTMRCAMAFIHCASSDDLAFLLTLYVDISLEA